ncbi:MAG TPA: hemerythrin domain-containing protein [Nitrospira sp.]|nr:hemerythrin domain-containing protein [Nitrospira sp.]
MSRLILQLKADHVLLKHTLKSAADFTKPAPERIGFLVQAKRALLGHLEKENRELYPALRTAAQTDPDINDIVDVFGSDMEQVAPEALEFFNKYGNPEAVAAGFLADVQNVIEFGSDLERLIILLGLRIGREEATLYPAYEAIQARKAACAGVK